MKRGAFRLSPPTSVSLTPETERKKNSARNCGSFADNFFRTDRIVCSKKRVCAEWLGGGV